MTRGRVAALAAGVALAAACATAGPAGATAPSARAPAATATGEPDAAATATGARAATAGGRRSATAPATGGPASTGDGVAAARGRGTVLSNETTRTRWAHPGQVVPIRRAPSRKARAIARTRLLNQDGLPEVYLLKRRLVDAKGRVWIQLRVPGRPNGRTGWVPRDALGPFDTVRTQLVVDRGAQTVTLRERGRVRLRFPVGVGKPATPTPGGRYVISGKLRFADSAVYGTRALGTSAYASVSDWPGGGVVGLHGTGSPQLIPGRPSNGCVRVRNADMERLYRAVPLGTPVHIR